MGHPDRTVCVCTREVANDVGAVLQGVRHYELLFGQFFERPNPAADVPLGSPYELRADAVESARHRGRASARSRRPGSRTARRRDRASRGTPRSRLRREIAAGAAGRGSSRDAGRQGSRCGADGPCPFFTSPLLNSNTRCLTPFPSGVMILKSDNCKSRWQPTARMSSLGCFPLIFFGRVFYQRTAQDDRRGQTWT